MRVLVCGGRNLDPSEVFGWLKSFGHTNAALTLGLTKESRIQTVIHGGASGADAGARKWGEREGVEVIAYYPDWRQHGKAAGPIRNGEMLAKGKPHLVIAFPGGKGTANMVRQAQKAGVPILTPQIQIKRLCDF